MVPPQFFRCTFIVVSALLLGCCVEATTNSINFPISWVNIENQTQRPPTARRMNISSGQAQPILPFNRAVKPRRCIGTCSGNKTEFDYNATFNCRYDNACFEKFYDCCHDYESCCGKLSGKGTADSNVYFTCVKMGTSQVTGADGVWMITVCPRTWPEDQTRKKCHNPADNPFHHPVEDYLPVVAENNFTYRNKHCAICHDMKKFTRWDMNVSTRVVPLIEHDLETKLKFLAKNNGTISFVYPRDGLARRYCADSYVQTKSAVSLEETVAANGLSKVPYYVIRRFSEVYAITNFFITPLNISCPDDTVYDKYLKYCRKGYNTFVNNSLSDTFLVVMWFAKSSIQYKNISTFSWHFKKALTTKFHLIPTQISNIKLNRQDELGQYLVTTFHLTLTPYQLGLIRANQRNGIPNDIPNQSKRFLKLLNFTGDFTFNFNGHYFPVIKLTSKQLTCVNGITLKHYEYKRDKTGNILEIRTGKNYSRKHFSIIEKSGGNITLCRLLLPLGCTNGSYVPLRQNEYTILANLSLYYNITNKIFPFGEYYIMENIDDTKITEPNRFNGGTRQNGIRNLPPTRSATVLIICLPYQRTFQNKENESSSDYSLWVLTLLGFSISIICLVLFLITYAMFIELRTLPGKNVMNLSFPLLLYQCLWLIGSWHSNSSWCAIFAISEHYFILVSFLAMSAISYHSCLVFSIKTFLVSKSDKGQRTFLKYSAVVWCCPAFFVAICVILDRTETLTVNYGTQCWLGTKNAKFYLFLLPIALLLLFNIIAFIQTALSLSRHQKQSKVLQKSKRQNLLISMKLSTLVGFPWIFAFFGVVFPDVAALEYLFVIFACSQGLHIGVAFLLNKKTLKLYKDRWNRNGVSNVANRGQPVIEL